MSRLRNTLSHVAALLVLPLLFGAWNLREYLTREHPPQLARASPSLLARLPRPAFDPALPSVVVLLGADLTEVTDALGPYEMFARVGEYNVVTAAPERRPTLLSGGLTVMPHYSLAEVDALLEGRPAAVVVVPNIPNVAEPANAPILPWLQKQAAAGALMHSWCKGAMALAHAGLLDGAKATAHWGDLAALERKYPRVQWVRGVRWVEHGAFVMSAGITSGIDASLRVIRRLSGDDVARRVARELRYPNYQFAIDPSVEQYALRPADLVLLANAAFGRPLREQLGLGLYPGVGELELSNLYDAHAYTMTADVVSVSEHGDFVQSAHGLTFLPSVKASSVDGPAALTRLDRLLIPGAEGRGKAASLVAAVAARAPSVGVSYLHADAPHRFGLEPVIEDLARTADAATATFALRRMEYRSTQLELAGGAWPLRTLAMPLLLSALGIALLHLARASMGRSAMRRAESEQRLNDPVHVRADHAPQS